MDMCTQWGGKRSYTASNDHVISCSYMSLITTKYVNCSKGRRVVVVRENGACRHIFFQFYDEMNRCLFTHCGSVEGTGNISL